MNDRNLFSLLARVGDTTYHYKSIECFANAKDSGGDYFNLITLTSGRKHPYCCVDMTVYFTHFSLQLG